MERFYVFLGNGRMRNWLILWYSTCLVGIVLMV
ncbi:hypothetical protein HL670_00370 [Serratia plymuthica]|nr:hypothetical protein HL670_00370 [Serratia plymuthica]